jgi:HPt (histidine-containing phosphotransfer) domain-containing protein
MPGYIILFFYTQKKDRYYQKETILEIKTPDRFKGKDAFYQKMLRLLVKDFPETWKAFDDFIADLEGAKSYVHRLKGAAGNLDMTPIYETAVQLEASLRNNAPDSGLYQKLIETCDDLKKSLPPA